MNILRATLSGVYRLLRRFYADFGFFISLLALKFGLSIWLFGEPYARVHDNLDSMVVYSAVAGELWTSGFETSVFDRFIGGASQWYHYTQVFSPQTLAYVLADARTAYFMLEVMGIAIAYWGMLMLLREFFGRHVAAQILACLFAFSISFHSFGLGLSAAPIVFWWALRQAPVGLLVILASFLVGLSTAFAIHGLFLPLVFVFVCMISHRKIFSFQSIMIVGVFFLGSLIASSGLIYAIIFDPPSHRSAWLRQAGAFDLQDFAETWGSAILEMNQHYAAIYLPGIIAPFILSAGFISGRWKTTLLVLVIIAVTALARMTGTHFSAVLPGPLASIQYDRLGQYNVILLLVLAASVLIQSKGHFSRAVGWVGVVSYGFVAFPQSVGLQEQIVFGTVPKELRDRGEEVLAEGDIQRFFSSEFFGGEGISRLSMRSAKQAFALHFVPDIYTCFHNALPEGARVLSIGVDPMIAPLHGIATIDGYHNYYPLSYKQRFREVIAGHLDVSARHRAYFDNWGNRLSSFVTEDTVDRLDLDAAAALGAGYVISAFKMDLRPVGPACSDETGPFLYALAQ